MRIFGRKANSPSADSLPPELRPYYQSSHRAQSPRVALLALPVLAVALVAGAVIWGGWWLTHRGSPNSAPLTQVGQSGHTTTNGPTNSSKPPTYLRANPAPKPTQSGSKSSSTTPPTTKPYSPPVPSLANTGPSEITLLLPLTAAALSTTIYEIRQRVRAAARR